MSIQYADLVKYLESGTPSRVLLPDEEFFIQPPSEPTEAPLNVEFSGLNDITFGWAESPFAFPTSTLMVMAATAIELYLVLYSPLPHPPEEGTAGTDAAWRLVRGVLSNPSDPNVVTTMRERDAILHGYRGWDPWKDNQPFQKALNHLVIAVDLLKRGSSIPRSGRYAHVGVEAVDLLEALQNAIRALAQEGNDVYLPMFLIGFAEYFQRPDGSPISTYTETAEHVENIFHGWIDRWWNLVQKRLPLRDGLSSEVSRG